MQPQPVNVNNSPLLSLSSGWHHIAESFTVLKVSFAFIYFSCIEWVINLTCQLRKETYQTWRDIEQVEKKKC